jgi:MFS family permease
VAIFAFSICSFGSGLAGSFGLLLLTRVLMGFAEGPVIPLAQNFVERESSAHRLGFNSGMLQAVGSALFGSILAPVLLIQIAENVGWRNAFFIAGVPGLLMGLIAWFYIRPSTAESRGQQEKSGHPTSKILRGVSNIFLEQLLIKTLLK